MPEPTSPRAAYDLMWDRIDGRRQDDVDENSFDLLDRVVAEARQAERDRLRSLKPLRVIVEDGEAVYDVHPDGEYLLRCDVLGGSAGSSECQKPHGGDPDPCPDCGYPGGSAGSSDAR